MAVTKIWPIKDSIRRVVEYAENHEKTQCSDLETVIHYAGNMEKAEQDQTIFVTGINCGRDTAFQEMLAVQERFDKTDGNVAYHAYQSFPPGEVSPQQCHQIGVELARQLWGEQHQVLVATHFNTGTYHNHFVLNSVSFVDGKKFNCNRAAYRALFQASDALCRKYGLSVIERPDGKTPRSLYFAEKHGEPTRYNLMRQAIDECIGLSSNLDYFLKSLARRGYILNCAPNRKYPTIRTIGSKKSVRLYQLGKGYSMPEIQKRIHQLNWEIQYPSYQADYHYYNTLKHSPVRKMKVRGSFKKSKKITGFFALYLHYCYFLGLLPKKKKHTPLSPQMREACRHLQQFSQQLELVHRAHLNTPEDVEHFLDRIARQIQQLQSQRTHCYNRLRRCSNIESRTALLQERDQCTAELLPLYRQRKIALRILHTRGSMCANLRAEQKLWQYLTKPEERQHHRSQSYSR